MSQPTIKDATKTTTVDDKGDINITVTGSAQTDVVLFRGDTKEGKAVYDAFMAASQNKNVTINVKGGGSFSFFKG
jgi:hypothetical protein